MHQRRFSSWHVDEQELLISWISIGLFGSMNLEKFVLKAIKLIFSIQANTDKEVEFQTLKQFK